MPTIFTHAIVGACIADVLPCRMKKDWKFFSAAVVCAMLPDADVIGFKFGVDYGDLFGHRGFSHSLLFAAGLGLVVALVFFRIHVFPKNTLLRLWLIFFLVTASHGWLDAMTRGGLGIGFFSPFDTDRYFFSFRPVQASNIGMGFFRAESLLILQSEFLWMIVPALMIWGMLRFLISLRSAH